MEKVDFEKLQQAMKRKWSDNAQEAKKRKLREASAPTSFKRTLTVESSRSPTPMEAPALALVPPMTRPSKSSKTIQLTSPASLVESPGIN